jgi:hypothetical protein
MITPYIAQQTVTDFGLRFPGLKYSAKLAITTDTAFTVPGTAPRYKALIKTVAAGEVWVALNATAAATAGTTWAASTSEMLTGSCPLCREVKAGDVIHFFSTTATTDVSIVLFALQTNN